MVNTITRRSEILVDYAGRCDLQKQFGCHRDTVLRALRFQSNSDIAVEIRRAAQQLGYKVVAVPTGIKA